MFLLYGKIIGQYIIRNQWFSTVVYDAVTGSLVTNTGSYPGCLRQSGEPYLSLFKIFFFKSLSFICISTTVPPPSAPLTLPTYPPTQPPIHSSERVRLPMGSLHINPPPFLWLDSAQCLVVGLCIFFHPLLDEGSRTTIRVRPYLSNKLPNDATGVWP